MTSVQLKNDYKKIKFFSLRTRKRSERSELWEQKCKFLEYFNSNISRTRSLVLLPELERKNIYQTSHNDIDLRLNLIPSN